MMCRVDGRRFTIVFGRNLIGQFKKMLHDHQPLSDIRAASFAHTMAAKTSWHRYGTKLRHCHRMYRVGRKSKLLILSEYVDKTTNGANHTAARAWNALPSSVRSAPSLLQFRRDLKTALHVSVIVLSPPSQARHLGDL